MRPNPVALSLGLVVAASTTAAADEAPRNPRFVVGGSLTVWLPQADADDFATTSLGVRPQLTYWIIPLVGVTAAFDWVFVSEKDGVADDITYYAISVGGRITMPRPARIKPYGEVLIGRHTIASDAFNTSDSDLGFQFGGGATFALTPTVAANAGAAYSTASIDTGFATLDVDALMFAAGVAAQF